MIAQFANERERVMAGRRRTVEASGQRFGRLVAISFVRMSENGHQIWRCACDCGATTEKSLSHMKRSQILSCGCLSGLLLHRRKQNHTEPWYPRDSEQWREWKRLNR